MTSIEPGGAPGLMGSAKRKTVEAKKNVPPTPELKAQKNPEVSREMERRADVHATELQALELDSSLEEILLEIDPKLRPESFQKIATIEILTSGNEISRKTLDESGRNLTTRRTYEGADSRLQGEQHTAFVKPASGETSFTYDPKTDKVYNLRRIFKDGTLTVEREENQDPQESANLKQLIGGREGFIKSIAKLYGIKPEEVPLNPVEMTFRMGIEAGSAAKREYVASRLNELLRFNSVPITVLREEADHNDISSVQEGVKSSDPDNPVREFTPDDWREIIRLNVPNEPISPEDDGETIRKKTLKQSLMRLACFDYLIQSSDRHLGNVLYDPSSGQIHGIDNGYSLALSQAVESTRPDGTKEIVAAQMDYLTSVPMEGIATHPDWKLDDDAMAYLRDMAREMIGYAQYRDRKEDWAKEHPGQQPPNGKAYEYIKDLFFFLHGNEKIAQRERLEFIRRLGLLISAGRPPELGSMLFKRLDGYEMNGAENEGSATQATPSQAARA